MRFARCVTLRAPLGVTIATNARRVARYENAACRMLRCMEHFACRKLRVACYATRHTWAKSCVAWHATLGPNVTCCDTLLIALPGPCCAV